MSTSEKKIKKTAYFNLSLPIETYHLLKLIALKENKKLNQVIKEMIEKKRKHYFFL